MIADIKEVYREMIAVHTILERAFAIDMGDIYVARVQAPDGKWWARVVVRDAERDFLIDIGTVDVDDNAVFEREWIEASKVYNASTQEERHHLMTHSRVLSYAPALMESMMVMGFVLRGTLN